MRPNVEAGHSALGGSWLQDWCKTGGRRLKFSGKWRNFRCARGQRSKGDQRTDKGNSFHMDSSNKQSAVIQFSPIVLNCNLWVYFYTTLISFFYLYLWRVGNSSTGPSNGVVSNAAMIVALISTKNGSPYSVLSPQHAQGNPVQTLWLSIYNLISCKPCLCLCLWERVF